MLKIAALLLGIFCMLVVEAGARKKRNNNSKKEKKQHDKVQDKQDTESVHK